MVFCELFKYLVVALTPAIFIVGLHLALEQPMTMFGKVYGAKPEVAEWEKSQNIIEALNNNGEWTRSDIFAKA